MSKKNDGGRAFPGEKDTRFGQSNDCNEGMTLRDWFAGQALAGAVRMDRSEPLDETAHAMARDAYAMADAMIAVRGLDK